MNALRKTVVALSVVLALVATAFAWLVRDTPTPVSQSLGNKVLDIGFPIAALTFVAVGELICRRHPRHLDCGTGFRELALSPNRKLGRAESRRPRRNRMAAVGRGFAFISAGA